MPDTTRTSDPLVDELVRIAQVGLHPGELADLHRTTGCLPYAFEHLARVSDAGANYEAQASELVQLLIQASKKIEGLETSRMAHVLLGVEHRHRDLPYETRRGLAIEIWDPEGVKDPASFTRRVLRKICKALAVAARRIDTAEGKDDESRQPAIRLGSARLQDQLQTPGIERLAFRAETWLTGVGQRPYQTDWTYTDRATQPGVDRYRLFRHANTVIGVEPMSDNIARIEDRGVDNYGYKAWLVLFREELSQDLPTVWTTRTVYEASPLSIEEVEWLALTVSHTPPKPVIRDGTFIAHFDMRFPPKRIVKFITPKNTLPQLLGPTTDVTTTRGVVRAHFAEGEMQRWMTHGLYWWPNAAT